MSSPLEASSLLSAQQSSRGRAGRSSLVDARARPRRARDFLERPAFDLDVAFEREVLRHLAEARPFPPGRCIGPYRVIAPIAVGGIGIVLEAVHETAQRAVALKVLRGGALFGRRRRELFGLQVEALERLRAAPPHPGLVELLESGETDDGTPWFSMELVRGVVFEPYVVASASTRSTECLVLFARLCDAVHHAHAHGVVHGDLAPANALVVESGRALKVIDFARTLDAPDRAATRGLVGTLDYTAPERLRADAASPPTVASDVFSLGAILFELLAGAPPHELRGLGLLASIRRAAEAPVPRPSSLRAGVPRDLEELALAALDRDPACRPATAAELAGGIDRHLRTGAGQRDMRAAETTADGHRGKAAPRGPTAVRSRFFRVSGVRATAGACYCPPLVSVARATPPWVDDRRR